VEGKEMPRKNAEKTLLICEYFIDLLTNIGDKVADLFAGTASMAMACIKNHRTYFGCELEENVWRPAVHRLGRTWVARERGDFTPIIAGISRSLSEQVFQLD
jgi:DNA modification methylase